jgi:hypothetical protein
VTPMECFDLVGASTNRKPIKAVGE